MAKKPAVKEALAVPIDRVIESDVANLDPGTGKGEHLAPLNAESWVILGKHKSVPAELEGATCAVLSWPAITKVDEATGVTTEYMPENAMLTVRNRAQGQILQVPLEACKEISNHGRPGDFA